ncbi:MAG: cation diffusion facilitator family transporter [Bacteroidota bacterium]
MAVKDKNFKTKVNAISWVLLLSILIMLIKFVAYYVTKSNALLSDALESFINIATSSFTLYSIYYSAKLKDHDHPYGHGKIEYLAVGFEGALILGTGVYILYEAFNHFIHPEPLQNVDLGIIITASTGLIMYFIGSFLKKKGRELESITLVADGEHFHLDTITSIALIIGLVLYHLTHLTWIDPLLAVLLAVHIMMSGFKLTKESIDRLLDKADFDTIQNVVNSLNKNRKDNWIDIHNLRMQRFGNIIHIDCHLTLPFYYALDQVHAEIKNLESDINKDFSQEVELFVHTDPCNEEFPCNLCSVHECAFRKQEHLQMVEWNIKNLMANKKHQL